MAANTWSASARLNLVTATLRRFGTLTRQILLRLFQTDVVSSAEGRPSCLDGAELRGRDRAWRPGDFAGGLTRTLTHASLSSPHEATLEGSCHPARAGSRTARCRTPPPPRV